MRLGMRLPAVDPAALAAPRTCPHGCGGRHFTLRQVVAKPLRDTKLAAVEARRSGCGRCGRAFRVYPGGVSHARTSARRRGLGVLRYLLGLGYGAVAPTLEALGHPRSKVAVYDAVRLPAGQALVAALGAAPTSVKCKGEWLAVGVGGGALGGAARTVGVLDSGEAAELVAWLAEVAAAVGADLLVTDGAGGCKTAADDLGSAHRVCKAHVVRNTAAWVERHEAALAADADGSLAPIRVDPAPAVAGVQALLRSVHERDPTPAAAAERRALHRRYRGAPPPENGEGTSLAYRLRPFGLDRWNLWGRLTRYRTRTTADGELLDGTDNASERAIGWWVKERHRTMRGYKRKASVLNVSRPVAWAGTGLEGRGVDLAPVVQ